ncbi:cupredoxin domain-containing protein [Acidihalobacter prosperus]
MKRFTMLAGALLMASFLMPGAAMAAEYTLVIKNHRFEPSELTVPAGKRVKLVIDNRDSSVEEFESHDLRREKIVPGNSKGVVWVGPLPAGKYHFYGEFHEDTAQGHLIAK